MEPGERMQGLPGTAAAGRGSRTVLSLIAGEGRVKSSTGGVLLQELEDLLLDPIADNPDLLQSLPVGALHLGGVLERPVQTFRRPDTGKHGTSFCRFPAAYRDHVVIAPPLLVELKDAVGPLSGNVNAFLLQHLGNQGG